MYEHYQLLLCVSHKIFCVSSIVFLSEFEFFFFPQLFFVVVVLFFVNKSMTVVSCQLTNTGPKFLGFLGWLQCNLEQIVLVSDDQ